MCILKNIVFYLISNLNNWNAGRVTGSIDPFFDGAAASAEAATTVIPAGGSNATFKGATGSAQDPPVGSLAELTLTIEAAGNNFSVRVCV